MKIRRFDDPRRGRRRFAIASLACALSLAACRERETGSRTAVPLVDLYEKDAVTGSATSGRAAPPPTIWRFDGAQPVPPPEKAAATRGWEAGPGIEGLAIRDGRLVGTATKEVSLLHLERSPSPDELDTVHAIEVKLRVSAGKNLQIDFSSGEKADFSRAAGYLKDFAAVTMSSPLLPGPEVRTYTLKTIFTSASSDIRHIFLRPTDAVGATFEIESVRLLFRHEYLAGIESGPGWHGLSEIYHESIVTRAPESLRISVDLPSRPWLDLSIGTVEEHPVTFRVGVVKEGGGEETVLLDKTLTRAHRWERAPLELDAFAGRRVTLSFSVAAKENGAIGFWGAPVVRSHDAEPAASKKERGKPRGVVLIWADTLRADHLGAYGYKRETSPMIDRMARDGALFRHNVSQATWTKVATPSLLTSLYPASHGVADFTDRIPAAATTLAEVFRKEGFATLSMSSILFTGKFTNLHQGFEELHESGSMPDKDSSKTSREYVDRLLPWLDRHQDAPFFVFLHVSDPHDPYKPYAPYDTMWADRSQARGHEKQSEEVRKFISDPLMRAFGMPNRAELVKAGYDADQYVAYDRDWYDGSIRAMDAEIGRLLEHLRSPAFADTLVIFTGDHGEEFLEHGRMFHGQTVYGELANTPLVFWGPAFLPGGVAVEETTEIVDVMPTILDLCGIDPPKEIQGKSLRPLLSPGARPASGEAAAAEPWTERPAFTQKAVTKGVGGAPPPYDTESFAVTFGGWKLIHNSKRADGSPEYELFDARKDPLNLENVAASHPDLVEQLRGRIEDWKRVTAAGRIASDAESQESLSPEDLERLRSLGYVQ